MGKTILILTHPDDDHALFVADALRIKGADVTLWQTSDFPTRSVEGIRSDEGRGELRVLLPGTGAPDVQPDVVWYRRPTFTLNEGELHPADRSFAMNQCRYFRDGLLSILAPCAFWVNPFYANRRANLKILQHAMALACGLEVPTTYYGNDPDEIRAFLRSHNGRVVYKPLTGDGAWFDDERVWLAYTALLTEEKLVDDDLLRRTPGIYQALVPKAHEVRITVIGRRAFPLRVLSQETRQGRVDYRRAYDELRYERCEVPRAILDACQRLLGRMELVFGCFDFIVTPEGRWVFLEVNAAGQFLFVEEATGAPVLDAFSEFLLQGRVDFDWDESRVGVRLADLDLTEEQRILRARHVAEPALPGDERVGRRS